MHLLRIPLKEPSAATNEQRVTREYCLLTLVFHEVADAVLRVAGCVQAFDGDVTEFEG